MKAKKITVLLFITALCLLTIFLVVLLDDSALANGRAASRATPHPDLSPGSVSDRVDGPACASERLA